MILLRRAAHGASFLLALACAAGALAAQGGRFSDRLDALTHFAPLWLVGGIVAGGLWVLFVRREGGFFTVVLAALAVLSSSALVAPELIAADKARLAPADGPTLKLIQFNVWGRNGDPQATADWIMAQKPDVVLLQEAYDTKQGVARRLSKRFSGRTTCAEPNPRCATTIFYNRPVLAEGGLMGGTEGPYLPGAWATLDGPGGPFTIATAHYTWPWPAGPQQAQARRMADTVRRFDRETTVVTGDFNSTPWSFSLRRQDAAFGLERRTRALASWPAGEVSRLRVLAPFPFLPIDHVYAGKAWRTVGVERGPRLGSDHYPVVVTLARVSPSTPTSPSTAAR